MKKGRGLKARKGGEREKNLKKSLKPKFVTLTYIKISHTTWT